MTSTETFYFSCKLQKGSVQILIGLPFTFYYDKNLNAANKNIFTPISNASSSIVNLG